MLLTESIFSTGSCSLNTAMYSLPADCCDLAKRVALSIQTIKHPKNKQFLVYI